LKVSEALAQASARLAAAGVEDARREARILLAAALGTDAAGLLGREEIDPAVVEPLLARRAAREPMAYILGRREFWGLSFLTTPASLIPRPDSETLIEAAIAARQDSRAVRRVLDLGTGTGCLLLAALTEFRQAFGVGVDLAPAAAALAARNAGALGLAGRTAFFAGDWAAALTGAFDLILSNPPYIRAGDVKTLMPEVADFEPSLALDGGADGLHAYRRILGALPGLLARDGVAVLELGAGQADAVVRMAAAEFATSLHVDLAGHDRALVLRRSTGP
jgi:release factor glutamine methyltransferase